MIDPGDRLLDCARTHEANNQTIYWENTSFEKFNKEPLSFDVILSASAFHWVSPEVGLKKAYDLLSVDGKFVLVSLKRSLPNELRKKLDVLYESHVNDFSKSGGLSFPLNTDNSIKFRNYYFKESNVVELNFETVFETECYIGLIKTMSDHRSIDKEAQNSLFYKLRNILDSYGKFNCKHTVIAKIYSKCSHH